jgi:hypothetical protein
MSVEDARPWWATDDPSVEGLDDDEDPIEVLRSARRGSDGDEDPDAHGARSGARAEGAASDNGTCGACPLCLGWRLLGEHHPDVADHLEAAGRHLAEARPEIAEHLAAAGRHLTAALRHLFEEHEAAPRSDAADAPFEHIVVDHDDEVRP